MIDVTTYSQKSHCKAEASCSDLLLKGNQEERQGRSLFIFSSFLFSLFSAISLAQQLRSKQSINTSHCDTPGTLSTHLFLSVHALFLVSAPMCAIKKKASLKQKVFEKVPMCKRTCWELMGAFRGLDSTSDN